MQIKIILNIQAGSELEELSKLDSELLETDSMLDAELLDSIEGSDDEPKVKKKIN